LLTPGGYAANEFPPPSRHDQRRHSGACVVLSVGRASWTRSDVVGG